MSHTFNYAGFFSTWHASDKKYGNVELEQPIPIMYRAHDPIIHTDEHPFCDDWFCPCHSLAQNYEPYNRLIGYPIIDGLLTHDEGMRLWLDRQV